jgi:hypothetical protein
MNQFFFCTPRASTSWIILDYSGVLVMALAAKDSRAQDSNAMTLTPRRGEESRRMMA